MPQTSVRSNLISGTPAGMSADSSKPDCLSKYNGEASATVPFGVFVAASGDDAFLKIAATSDQLLGLVRWTPGYAPGTEVDATTGEILAKQYADIAVKGRFLVYPEAAVTVASEVHVRATGTGTPGALRGTADSTNTINISKFARWREAGSATDPAVLEIDMVGQFNQAADT